MTGKVLPIYPLKTVLYPRQVVPLDISEDRYKRMLEDILAEERLFGIVLIFSAEEATNTAVPHPIGTVARIDEWNLIGKDHYRVKAVGIQRFRIIEFLDNERPYLKAAVDYWDEEPADSFYAKQAAADLNRLFCDYLSLIVFLSQIALPASRFLLPSDATEASYHIASNLQVDLTEKQRLLEEPSTIDRLQRERMLIKREQGFLQRLVGLQGLFASDSLAWQGGPGIPDRLT